MYSHCTSIPYQQIQAEYASEALNTIAVHIHKLTDLKDQLGEQMKVALVRVAVQIEITCSLVIPVQSSGKSRSSEDCKVQEN